MNLPQTQDKARYVESMFDRIAGVLPKNEERQILRLIEDADQSRDLRRRNRDRDQTEQLLETT